MDGDVVQVIPVSCSLDEEGVRSWSVRLRGIVQALSLFLKLSHMVLVVTWSGCYLARMSLPGFCWVKNLSGGSAGASLSTTLQKRVRRSSWRRSCRGCSLVFLRSLVTLPGVMDL